MLINCLVAYIRHNNARSQRAQCILYAHSDTRMYSSDYYYVMFIYDQFAQRNIRSHWISFQTPHTARIAECFVSWGGFCIQTCHHPKNTSYIARSFNTLQQRPKHDASINHPTHNGMNCFRAVYTALCACVCCVMKYVWCISKQRALAAAAAVVMPSSTSVRCRCAYEDANGAAAQRLKIHPTPHNLYIVDRLPMFNM